ncbi:MAG: hydrogenase 3 maturation endopeptidase HyCI [Firmicutes bacterium]|nr:hydrogenase 3 maturation endopeptidase HyCI [Bacillota bacterium]
MSSARAQVIAGLANVLNTAARVAFLGVGSPLRSDDGLGLCLTTGLKQALQPGPGQEFRFFLGESAPENFSGAIREFMPDYLVIFDAADLGETPGTFALIAPDRIGGVSFSTHMMPLKILADYLVMAAGCQVMVIGVQPENLDFGETLSPAVAAAVGEFIKELIATIR